MAWSDPTANLTFADEEVVTHTKLNLIRDDLLETAPAKASTAHGYFVATGANAIAERVPDANRVGTSETTTSTSYTDLATSGPAVTVTTGTGALCLISCELSNSGAGNSGYMAVDVSGATTVSANDGWAVKYESSNADDRLAASAMIAYTSNGLSALTAGSNVFTAKYRCTAGTQTFLNRNMWVWPL